MAAQRLNRGLATLAVTGVLVLVALGAALLALQIDAHQAVEARRQLELQHLDAALEAALLDLLANPAPLEAFVRERSRCRSRQLRRIREGLRLQRRFDRCRMPPGSVQIRLEALGERLRRTVKATVRKQDDRWRIVPGSWHDFDP